MDNEVEKLKTELRNLKNEYKDFVYIVLHDMGAPFRTIEGFANIILKNHGDSFDEKTKRHFDLIIRSSEQGKNILETIMEYSRLETKQNAFSDVECSKVIEDVKSILANMIQTSGARIDVINHLPKIKADHQQITQVFYHLIKNALLYQKEGNKPIISIKAEKKPTEWLFCIQDNGIGIQAGLVEKTFKVLRRAVGNEYQGDGMGLAVAKKILHRHGGDIWVDSVEGEGSSFFFTIPCEEK